MEQVFISKPLAGDESGAAGDIAEMEFVILMRAPALIAAKQKLRKLIAQVGSRSYTGRSYRVAGAGHRVSQRQ